MKEQSQYTYPTCTWTISAPLSNIPQEAKVKLPSMATYEDMEEKWGASPTWLSLIPRKYYIELEELQPLQTDKNNVMAVPVSHSAYPAYAFIYFGKKMKLCFTQATSE